MQNNLQYMHIRVEMNKSLAKIELNVNFYKNKDENLLELYCMNYEPIN